MSGASSVTPPPGVVVVIPAFNEERRIAATVAAARTLLSVVAIVVADDGSHDATARLAEAAGATVVRHRHRRGKAAAMTTGAAQARRDGYVAHAVLFLDADLEASAGSAGALVSPVLAGAADMTVAILPPAVGAGGHGFVVRLAASGIDRATGWRPVAPLSGQRCVTRELLDAVQPLARGFGVEVGLTIDALRRGARVVECEVPLGHRVTGRGWRDQVHRARQYRDVRLALAARGVVRVG
ncbi:MAG TPA: glycosyltransferase family 2 protein [Mycobacteriales bacterium]|nr:glycosyltransferase family 2 protein [Mycobacteriales bacterium]